MLLRAETFPGNAEAENPVIDVVLDRALHILISLRPAEVGVDDPQVAKGISDAGEEAEEGEEKNARSHPAMGWQRRGDVK